MTINESKSKEYFVLKQRENFPKQSVNGFWYILLRKYNYKLVLFYEKKRTKNQTNKHNSYM